VHSLVTVKLAVFTFERFIQSLFASYPCLQALQMHILQGPTTIADTQ